MARVCEICQKNPLVGNNVSHAKNRTKKVSRPNLQIVKHFDGKRTRKVKVCTQCIKSGYIQKGKAPKATKES